MLSRENRLIPESCALCGESCATAYIDHVNDRLGVSSADWSFLRCSDCGSANLHPRPSPEEIRAFYPPEYSTGAIGSNSALRRTIATVARILLYDRIPNYQVKWVLNATGLRPGARVLDIGCGNGSHLQVFHRNGMEVVTADFHEGSIAYIRDVRKLKAIMGDVETCLREFGPASFDMITAFHLIEHLLSPCDFAVACRKLLRPGSWLAGAISTADGTLAGWLGKRWACYTEAPRHISLPSQDGLRRLLEKAGFTLTKISRESIVNLAGIFALSLVPRATTSVSQGHVGYQLAGGLVWLASLPLVWLTETLGQPSVVLFVGRSNSAKADRD